MNPADMVLQIAGEYNRLLKWLHPEIRALSIERRFPFFDKTNEAEVRKAQWDWVSKQIEKAGGVEEVFFKFPLLDIKSAMTELDSRIEKLKKEKIIGSDGRRHKFSNEDFAYIRKRAELYFQRLDQDLTKTLLAMLSKSKVGYEFRWVNQYLGEDSITMQFEGALAELAGKILLEQNSNGESLSGIRKMEGDYEPRIQVRTFRYGQDVRTLALGLLNERLSEQSSSWSLEGRRAVFTILTSIVSSALGADWRTINAIELEQPLRSWFVDQVSLLEALGDSTGCRDLLMGDADDSSVSTKNESKKKKPSKLKFTR